MSYGLSIDVGTSFTAAAVLRTDGHGPEEPRILPLGGRGASIPTVVFVGSDGTRLVGEVAERRGLAEPGNVAREFKRRMGDSVPLVLGGTPILPEELFAVVVDWVVGVATEREGEPPASITLTHPVGWGEHRTSLLKGALAAAGFDDVVLLSEPEAAALSYAARERVGQGSTLAVYDLGGGTFDATVVRKADADTFTILGAPQGIERLGGADFDQDVFTRVLDDSDVSFGDLEHSSPEVLAALNRLRRECAEAKEALSSDSEVTVSVMVPGFHSQVRLVRSEFELMVEPALQETVETMRSALESAGVRVEDLSAILLIGGSSRIPLVAQLLSAEFNRPLAIDVDPKASVALGAAFATAALEDTEDAAQAVPAAASGEGTEADPSDRRRNGVNAAGFSVPSRAGAASPQHGPAGRPATRRLGFRVGAVVSAVALLGVATATATNAPNPFTAVIADWTGDPRADAAEEPNAAPVTPVPLAAPEAALGTGIGPLVDAGAPTLQDKLFGVGAPPAAGAAPRAGATASPDSPTSDAERASTAPRTLAEPRSETDTAPGTAPSTGTSSGPGANPGTTPGGPPSSSPSSPTPNPVPSPVDPTTPAPTPVPDPTLPPVTPTVPPTTPPTTPVPDPTLPPVTPTVPPTVPPTTPPVTPAPEPSVAPTTAPVIPPPTAPGTEPPPTAPPGTEPPVPGENVLALSVASGI